LAIGNNFRLATLQNNSGKQVTSPALHKESEPKRMKYEKEESKKIGNEIACGRVGGGYGPVLYDDII